MIPDFRRPRGILMKHGKQLVTGVPNKLLILFLKRKWLYIGVFFALLFVLALGINIKNVIMVVLLALVASFSTYYKKYIKFTIGFEFVTLATVLTAIAYGPLVGALVGLVSSIAAEVIPQLIDTSSFLWIISVPASAFVVYFFHGLGVPLFWLGIISILVQFIISEPIRIFWGDEYTRTMGWVNIVTTLGWTILWFRLLAPPLLSILIFP